MFINDTINDTIKEGNYGLKDLSIGTQRKHKERNKTDETQTKSIYTDQNLSCG